MGLDSPGGAFQPQPRRDSVASDDSQKEAIYLLMAVNRLLREKSENMGWDVVCYHKLTHFFLLQDSTFADCKCTSALS